jgi:hypothetical protein
MALKKGGRAYAATWREDTSKNAPSVPGGNDRLLESSC